MCLASRFCWQPTITAAAFHLLSALQPPALLVHVQGYNQATIEPTAFDALRAAGSQVTVAQEEDMHDWNDSGSDSE